MSKIIEALKTIVAIIPLITASMELVESAYSGQVGKGTEKKQAVLDTVAAIFAGDSALWGYLQKLVSLAINALSLKMFNSTGKDPEQVINLTEKVGGNN